MSINKTVGFGDVNEIKPGVYMDPVTMKFFIVYNAVKGIGNEWQVNLWLVEREQMDIRYYIPSDNPWKSMVMISDPSIVGPILTKSRLSLDDEMTRVENREKEVRNVLNYVLELMTGVEDT